MFIREVINLRFLRPQGDHGMPRKAEMVKVAKYWSKVAKGMRSKLGDLAPRDLLDPLVME